MLPTLQEAHRNFVANTLGEIHENRIFVRAALDTTCKFRETNHQTNIPEQHFRQNCIEPCSLSREKERTDPERLRARHDETKQNKSHTRRKKAIELKIMWPTQLVLVMVKMVFTNLVFFKVMRHNVSQVEVTTLHSNLLPPLCMHAQYCLL